MYKYKSGKSIDLSKAKEIAAGGEGRILEHPNTSSKVIKLYFQPRKAEFAKHLDHLRSLPQEFFIAPIETIFTNKNEVAGFEMFYVDFNEYYLFNNLFNKGFCTSNGVTDKFKVEILESLKTIVEELHKMDIVVGDLNQYNIFVNKHTGKPLFVDTDSYGTPNSPHSGVVIDEVRDWTNPLVIDKQTDSWAFDMLAFWTMTFVHPFKWVVKGNSETLEQRVKAKKSILSRIPDVKIPAVYKPIVGEPLKQFEEVFNGRRYMVSFTNAVVQTNVVVKQQVASVSLNIREVVSDVRKVHASENFIAINRNGFWDLMETKLHGVIRFISSSDGIENLFPSNGPNVYQLGNKLKQENGLLNSFAKAGYYFNDGFLLVIDYDRDMQHNFNLNNQLVGIDNSQTPIYAKSVVITDAPIQNFGSKKYLNIPVGNRFTMIEIPMGTKNAYYSRDYVGLEERKSNKTRYSIFSVKTKKDIELDYFPYFAVKGNILFVPEDNQILVYKDLQLIQTLDADICTRSSKLYSTSSGILLLENNILYLLNSK